MDTTQDLTTLLSEGKSDEAEALVKDMVAAPLDEKDKGAALTSLASMYLDISNEMNTSYLEALEESIASIEAIDAAEKQALEQAEIMETRANLNGQ